MATAQADILTNSTVVTRGTHVTTVDRKYRVTGITGTDVDGQAEAIAAVPANGSALSLPSIGVIVRLRSAAARLENDSSPSVMIVSVQYTSDSFDDPTDPTVPSMRLGVTATEITTTTDKNGDPITTQRDTGSASETTVVPVRIPLATVELDRIFEIVSPDVPGTLADRFVGKANDRRWNGEDAGMWLCTDAKAEATTNYDASAGSNNWSYTFFFERADERERVIVSGTNKTIAWNRLAVFIDNATGKPVEPLVNGESVKEVLWVELADFNSIFPI